MNDELKYLLTQTAQGKFSRRAFMGRAAAAGITAASASTLLASAAHAAGPQKGGTLKMGMGGGETTDALDQGTSDSPVPFSVGRTWGDTIVRVAGNGDLEPQLAESFESSADAKVWSFKIRKGVEFHNGQTMTVDDVLKTFQRHSNAESKSGALGIMQGIESIKADGDRIQFSLSTANADLPYLLADYHLIVQPGGGMDNPNAGIGTGAYKIASAEAGVRYQFEKNANDWNADRGYFDQVEMLIINDSTARTSALQSGQVHMINRVDPKVARLLGRAPGVMIKNVSGRGHYVFIMHCDAAPFDNRDLRLALKYAIDRQEMVDKILDGFGGVGNDIPINAAYPLFDEPLAQRMYDPEKAAAHYKASGHDGSPIILRVAEGAFPGAVDAAALFQQSAAKCGIPLEIKREPDDGYWSNVWNVQPFCASYWGGRPVQDQMYSTAYLSTEDWNDTKFKNADFDALILQARAETDLVKRKALYGQIARILHDDGGVICPMFNDFIDAVNEKVAGWENNPNAEMMNGYAAQQCWMA